MYSTVPRRLNAKPDDPRKHQHHRITLVGGIPLQSLQPILLNGLDLFLSIIRLSAPFDAEA